MPPPGEQGRTRVRPPLVFGSCPVREFRNVDTVHMGERARRTMAMHKNHKKGGGREQARDVEDKQRHEILELLPLMSYQYFLSVRI